MGYLHSGGPQRPPKKGKGTDILEVTVKGIPTLKHRWLR